MRCRCNRCDAADEIFIAEAAGPLRVLKCFLHSQYGVLEVVELRDYVPAHVATLYGPTVQIMVHKQECFASVDKVVAITEVKKCGRRCP